MPATIPCLWFDDQGQAAAEFYTSVFPHSEITGMTHYGPGGHRQEGTVMTVNFVLDGQEYLALNGGPEFTFSEAISFQIITNSPDETDRFWKALTDDGEEGQCGWLKDRFGVSWQVVPRRLGELLGDPDPARASRAMAAMLTMRKIDVLELERAADGA